MKPRTAQASRSPSRRDRWYASSRHRGSSRTTRIHRLDHANGLGRGLQEVVMILDPDNYAMPLAVGRAFPEFGDHPFERLLEGMTLRRLPAGEDADYRRAQLGGHLRSSSFTHPRTSQLLRLAASVHGEVVSNARADDRDSVQERRPLQLVDGIVARNLRIAREVISGRIQGFEPVLALPVVNGILERHGAGARSGLLKEYALRASLILLPLRADDSSAARWRDSPRQRTQSSPNQKLSTIDGGVHVSPYRPSG